MTDGNQARSTADPQLFVPEDQTAVLAVLPHPDDESFSSGGTLARCAAAGVAATYLCGTYGDMGRRLGNPPVADRESLRDVRLGEMQAAALELGLDVVYLGLRDKCVEFEDPDELADRIAKSITATGASAVITFYPGFGVHPDHDALGHATVLAVRSLPANTRPLLLGVAVTGADAQRAGLDGQLLGEPDVRVDISEVYMRKIGALKAHRSQTVTMFAQIEKSFDFQTLKDLPGAPEPDDETRAWRERLTERESFYVLDPDAKTLLEN